MLAGGVRPFDDAAWRKLVGRDVERAHDIAACRLGKNLCVAGDSTVRGA
jgi:hypothetical protein